MSPSRRSYRRAARITHSMGYLVAQQLAANTRPTAFPLCPGPRGTSLALNEQNWRGRQPRPVLRTCRQSWCGTIALCDKSTACQPPYRKSMWQRQLGPWRTRGHNAYALGPIQRTWQPQSTLPRKSSTFQPPFKRMKCYCRSDELKVNSCWLEWQPQKGPRRDGPARVQV
jgi:hypothetical protein